MAVTDRVQVMARRTTMTVVGVLEREGGNIDSEEEILGG